MTRLCDYKHCEFEFEPRRPHQRFHSDSCRYADWVERQENSSEASAQRVGEGVGSRGGNVRDLDTARELQSTVKAKRDWSGAIDEQIRQTLLTTSLCHANDLDGLGVPSEHRNLIGTRMARYCNKGWMEPTMERRKVTHPAANGRRNPVYRITPKGWKELRTVGISAGRPPSQDEAGPPSRRMAFTSAGDGSTASTDSGEPQRRPTGAPSPQGADRSDKPEPVPSASDRKGSGSGVTPQASEPDRSSEGTLSLLPEVDPKAWAA